MMNTKAAFKKVNKGFSIVELLLVVLIAATLIWQVCVIYKNMHRTHQLQTALSELLHHAIWFEDVMGHNIKNSNLGSCHLAKNQKVVTGYLANQLPKQWQVNAARNTDVLLLSHCEVSPMGFKKQLIQSIYYLKKNTQNTLYTLYQKQQNKKSMALQDDIKSLNWYLAYQTSKEGQATAPQAVGLESKQQVVAVSWKVIFANPNPMLANKKLLTRTFYGYMNLTNELK